MISVCMATYNGEKYIQEQLESILKQIGPNDEIIISDDGSKDATQQVIESIGDKRIRYVKNTGTHGFTHNFENALRLARGEYIFLADQDDIWLDNKVDVVMKALQNADFVTHDCVTVDPNMQILSQSRFKEFNIKPGFWNHLIKSRYLGCCMAFNRQVLEASLPFPDNDFLVEHDIWLAAVAFAYFKVSLIDEPLIYYRRHGKNASSGGFNKGYSMRVKMEKRLYRIKKLIDIYPNIKERRKLYVGGHSEKIKWGLRALLNRPFWGKKGRMCYIGKPCYIARKKDLLFGDKVRIYPGMRTETQNGGKIVIGDNVSIGQNFHAVAVQNKLKIGSNVTISGNVFISNCDHTFNEENLLALEQPLIIKDTCIEDNCFIGYGAVILAGTHLGKHCVVGANSVVRGIFPDNTLLAGSPAKVLKKFEIENKNWIKVQEV